MKTNLSKTVMSLAIVGGILIEAGLAAHAAPAQFSKGFMAGSTMAETGAKIHKVANLGRSLDGLNFKYKPKFNKKLSPKFKPKAPGSRPRATSKPKSPSAPSAWKPAKPSGPKIGLPRANGLKKAGAPAGFKKGVLPTGPRNLGKDAITIGSKSVRKAKRFRLRRPNISVKQAALFTGIAAFVALQFVPNIVISQIDFNDEDENAEETAQN